MLLGAGIAQTGAAAAKATERELELRDKLRAVEDSCWAMGWYAPQYKVTRHAGWADLAQRGPSWASDLAAAPDFPITWQYHRQYGARRPGQH